MILAKDFEDFVKLLMNIEGLDINYIGLKDFIENKIASGRSQDIVDLKEINKINPKS